MATLEDRQWEKFSGGPTTMGPNALRVTINRQGHIYMNAGAYKAFNRPEAVALYYNRELDAIAIEPSYPRFEQNFKVIRKDRGYVILAAPFCRHYKIKVPNTERFLNPNFDEKGVLTLNLRETVTVGGFTIRRRAGIPARHS